MFVEHGKLYLHVSIDVYENMFYIRLQGNHLLHTCNLMEMRLKTI